MTYPVLQLALDFVDLDRALKAAREGIKGGVDWLEAGTPLIKSEGLEAVRRLKSEFPDTIIVADMKVMDAGRTEVECAAKAGADVVDVLGAAADATIEECVRAAQNYGTKIVVDTIGIKSVKERAIQAEKMGADFVTVHTAIDEQMEGATPFGLLEEVASAINIPGGAITKSADVRKAAEEIKRAMKTGKGIKTILYRRVSLDRVRDVLEKVSTANISDAMHRQGELKGVKPVLNNVKLVGVAVTVRTYPGDWAKPVEAIDRAGAGDVIVIDAGGAEPAVWGELATHSCVRKKISGVVIDGAIRDVEEVRKLKFPAFARVVTSAAGEPKGFGEIGVPVRIGGLVVHPGDWIVGDEDGVVVIPQKEVVEIANRAMDVLERENRIRKEIMDGGTLGGVTHLLRWEKNREQRYVKQNRNRPFLSAL